MLHEVNSKSSRQLQQETASQGRKKTSRLVMRGSQTRTTRTQNRPESSREPQKQPLKKANNQDDMHLSERPTQKSENPTTRVTGENKDEKKELNPERNGEHPTAQDLSITSNKHISYQQLEALTIPYIHPEHEWSEPQQHMQGNERLARKSQNDDQNG